MFLLLTKRSRGTQTHTHLDTRWIKKTNRGPTKKKEDEEDEARCNRDAFRHTFTAEMWPMSIPIRKIDEPMTQRMRMSIEEEMQ